MLAVTIARGDIITLILMLGALGVTMGVTGFAIGLDRGLITPKLFPPLRKVEAFIRDFEWTWTRAAVFSVALWFAAIALLGVFPSWWLLFAQNTLGWGPQKFWLFKLRDVLAAGIFSLPFGAFVLVPYYLQKTRRRLRSQSESRPTGGYR
jgi:hypothetical protein